MAFVNYQAYDLHIVAFYLFVAIAVVVFSILIYSLVKFRKSKSANSSNFHAHTGIEILWTVIPFVLLIFLAIPAISELIKIHNVKETFVSVEK